jgi:hypothetical protein
MPPLKQPWKALLKAPIPSAQQPEAFLNKVFRPQYANICWKIVSTKGLPQGLDAPHGG